jgi:hypothetical protein
MMLVVEMRRYRTIYNVEFLMMSSDVMWSLHSDVIDEMGDLVKTVPMRVVQ